MHGHTFAVTGSNQVPNEYTSGGQDKWDVKRLFFSWSIRMVVHDRGKDVEVLRRWR